MSEQHQLSIRKQKRTEHRVSALAALDKILAEFRNQSPQGIAFLSNAVFRAYPPTPQELRRFSDRARALQIGTVPSPQAKPMKKSGQRSVPALEKDVSKVQPKVKLLKQMTPMPLNTQWHSTKEYEGWQQLVDELKRRKAQGLTQQELDGFRNEQVEPARLQAYARRAKLIEEGASKTQQVVEVPSHGNSHMDDDQ